MDSYSQGRLGGEAGKWILRCQLDMVYEWDTMKEMNYHWVRRDEDDSNSVRYQNDYFSHQS